MSENSKENFEKKWKIKNNFRKLLENLSNYYHIILLVYKTICIY